MKSYGLSVHSTPIILTGSDDDIIAGVRQLLHDIKKHSSTTLNVTLSCSATIALRTEEEHRISHYFRRLVIAVKQKNYQTNIIGYHITIEQWVAIGLLLDASEAAKSFHHLLRSRLINRVPLDFLQNLHNYPDVQAKAQLLLDEILL